jgi:hypothetical protein
MAAAAATVAAAGATMAAAAAAAALVFLISETDPLPLTQAAADTLGEGRYQPPQLTHWGRGGISRHN